MKNNEPQRHENQTFAVNEAFSTVPDKTSCVKEPAAGYPAQVSRHIIDEILALPDGVRAELIDGKIHYMATPTRTHQSFLVELTYQIFDYIKKHHGKCQVFPAPFAVFLHADNSIYLEPDLSVICDPEKLDERGCHGAPDWVVEIASVSSWRLDSVTKLEKYRHAGVKEYWIINPECEFIDVHTFALNPERAQRYMLDAAISPFLFPDLSICLKG